MSFAHVSKLCIIAICSFAFVNTCSGRQSTAFDTIVELRDGTSLEAQLRNIDDDSAVFSIDGDDRTISNDSIDRIRFSELEAKPSDIAKSVVLVDGSKLFCQAIKVGKRELTAKCECDVELKISTRLVDHVCFSVGDDEFADKWNKTTAAKRESDALIVSRDQKLQMIDGVIGDISAESVSFTVGDRTADVQLSRLVGLLFYRRVTDEFAPAAFVLQLIDGSRIEVRSLAVEDNKFLVNTIAGARISVLPDVISSMDFGVNREMWLTELDLSLIHI